MARETIPKTLLFDISKTIRTSSELKPLTTEQIEDIASETVEFVTRRVDDVFQSSERDERQCTEDVASPALFLPQWLKSLFEKHGEDPYRPQEQEGNSEDMDWEGLGSVEPEDLYGVDSYGREEEHVKPHRVVEANEVEGIDGDVNREVENTSREVSEDVRIGREIGAEVGSDRPQSASEADESDQASIVMENLEQLREDATGQSDDEANQRFADEDIDMPTSGMRKKAGFQAKSARRRRELRSFQKAARIHGSIQRVGSGLVCDREGRRIRSRVQKRRHAYGTKDSSNSAHGHNGDAFEGFEFGGENVEAGSANQDEDDREGQELKGEEEEKGHDRITTEIASHALHHDEVEPENLGQAVSDGRGIVGDIVVVSQGKKRKYGSAVGDAGHSKRKKTKSRGKKRIVQGGSERNDANDHSSEPASSESTGATVPTVERTRGQNLAEWIMDLADPRELFVRTRMPFIPEVDEIDIEYPWLDERPIDEDR